MKLAHRLRAASAASLKHFSASLLVALASAGLVFGLWYPYPYSQLVGGRELFLLLITVDVISGPLLTLVVFDPNKPRRELWRDIGIIVCLQLSALAYGLTSVAEARPVWLAFEGNRFRVVRVPDIDPADLAKAPENLRTLSWLGPRVVGVRLAQSTDSDYLQSIKLSLDGLHPAFRPSRWMEYGQQRPDVLANTQPLPELRKKHPEQGQLIDDAVRTAGLGEEHLGYLPLAAGTHTDWVVIIGLDDAEPKAYLPLDGW